MPIFLVYKKLSQKIYPIVSLLKSISYKILRKGAKMAFLELTTSERPQLAVKVNNSLKYQVSVSIKYLIVSKVLVLYSFVFNDIQPLGRRSVLKLSELLLINYRCNFI